MDLGFATGAWPNKLTASIDGESLKTAEFMIILELFNKFAKTPANFLNFAIEFNNLELSFSKSLKIKGHFIFNPIMSREKGREIPNKRKR